MRRHGQECGAGWAERRAARESLGGVTPSGPSTPGPVDPGLHGLVDQARSDLAGRLGVAAQDITTVSAAVVTWPDSGLGCRERGRVYLQVPTDGSRIVLSHGGRDYAYHTGGRTLVPFLCEHPG